MTRIHHLVCILALVAGGGYAVAETPDEAVAPSGAKALAERDAKQGDLEAERRALKAAEEGDVAAAQRGFDALVKTQPNRLDYRHRLAAMHALSGKPERAEAQAVVAVALRPDFGAGKRLAVTARGWRDARRPTRAPSVDDVRIALGEGRVRTAARWADEAMVAAQTDQARGQLHRERARALLALGRPAAAQEALKQAGLGGQTDASMWFEMGESALQLGAGTAAKFYFEMAAEVGGANDAIAEQARLRVKALRASGNP